MTQLVQILPKASDEWLTPPEVLNKLGGWQAFDLDPCAMVDQPWRTARHQYTVRDNGLARPWFGEAYLNPPYSTALFRRFMQRMAEHGRGIALIFARTDTATFFQSVWDRASALLFARGRLPFCRPDGQPAVRADGRPAEARASSVFCAYGPRAADVLAECGIAGQFVPLSFQRSVLVAALEPTWCQVIVDWMRTQRGPVRLDVIYRAVAAHRKAHGKRHLDAKVRQVLQEGPFRRVAPGEWELAV